MGANNPDATTGSTVTNPRMAQHLARLRTGRLVFQALRRLAAAVTKKEPTADAVYAELIERSGGKLTDSLEREAENRLRQSLAKF